MTEREQFESWFDMWVDPKGFVSMSLKKPEAWAAWKLTRSAQGADARPVATSVIDHCWRMYQEGQISADHTAKEVFAEVLQSFAKWQAARATADRDSTYPDERSGENNPFRRIVYATRDAAPSDAQDAARWRELKQHTHDTEKRRGCTASEYGQANWLLNYATMDDFMDECIKYRVRAAIAPREA